MEIEKAKSLDIARLLAFWGLMSGNKMKNPRKPCKNKVSGVIFLQSIWCFVCFQSSNPFLSAVKAVPTKSSAQKGAVSSGAKNPGL